jgi:hypothetical protein
VGGWAGGGWREREGGKERGLDGWMAAGRVEARWCVVLLGTRRATTGPDGLPCIPMSCALGLALLSC